MNTHGRIIVLSALLGAQAFAAPFFAVGDNAELFLTGSVGVRFDDNIYLRSPDSAEVDDTITSFTPGLDYVFGRNAALGGNLFFREEILRYSDNDQQNTNLSNFGLNTLYSNGKTKVDFGAVFAELAQNEISVPGAIVDRDVLNFRALAEFGLTEKTSLGVGARFDSIDYAPANFTDSDIWTAPLDVFFDYSEKLALSLGYRHRTTDLSNAGIDSKDHFFNIGARGDFSPKLTGQIRVGFVTRDFDNNQEDDQLGLDSNLLYRYSEKTEFRLSLSNDFGSSAVGQSTEDFTVMLGAASRFDQQWAWNANLAMRAIDYPTRSDDFLEGTVGVSYSYNNFVNFAANLTHRTNSSDLTAAEFDNNVFSLAANLRY